jgi:hypothetical protein
MNGEVNLICLYKFNTKAGDACHSSPAHTDNPEPELIL